MNTLSITIITIVSLILLTGSFVFIVTGIRMANSISEYNSIKKEELHSNILNSLVTANKLIEDLVDDTFNKYILFHSEIVETDFINSELQNKMVKDISTTVLTRISKPVFNYISIFINEEKIIDIINETVITTIINFSISKNSQQ